MFERVSQQFRQIMNEANREAQRLNHQYIGTEHQLLGLLRVNGTLALKVLQSLQIDPGQVSSEIERIVQRGNANLGMVFGMLPHTPRAKKVIEYAVEEHQKSGSELIETEHILFGLLREVDGVAYIVLSNFGVRLEDVRDEVSRERKRMEHYSEWLTHNSNTVGDIAQFIYHEQRWDSLPILADALEEAGCSDEHLLGHLRQPEHLCKGNSISGCWVIDRLLKPETGSPAKETIPTKKWWQFWR
jgi:ATP-dependent Clp protease ATP-binding subunit ClpA